jgi:hypothetical protein
MKTFTNAEKAERSKLLGMLFRGLTYTGKGDPKDVAEVYLSVLADISNAALESAVEDFLKGRVNRKAFGFVPSTDELMIQAQKWEDVYNPPAKALEIEAPVDEISPEERARMIPRIKALAEEIGRRADAEFDEVLSRRRANLERVADHFAGDFLVAKETGVRISPTLARQLAAEVYVDDPVEAE